MVLQVLEWISKLPSFLSQTGPLLSEYKRKKVGRELVALHQSISRLAVNDERVLRLMEQLANSSDKMVESLRPSLTIALTEQRTELLNVGELFCKNGAILAVFGDDLLKHAEQLLGVKWNFLDVVRKALNEQKPGATVLPKEIDLEKLELYRSNPDFCSPVLREDNSPALKQECDLTTVFTSNTEELKRHAKYLVEEAKKTNSTEVLQRTADGIATLIKNNFKMQELF